MKCEREGCGNEGMDCTELTGDQVHYCPTHIKDAGFCAGCGQYCAGQEHFEFNPAGLCQSCQSEQDEQCAEVVGFAGLFTEGL